VTRESTNSIERRAILKRAAAAGALTWTAPAIIGSFASPAAASTGPVPPGCHIAVFNNQCEPNSQGTPCNQATFPTGCVANPAVAQCLVVTPSETGNCQQDSTITVSVNTSLCPGCSITYAQAKSGNDCPVPPASFPTQSVTFPAISSPGYAQFAVAVLCS
jgi:hypothetical protein